MFKWLSDKLTPTPWNINSPPIDERPKPSMPEPKGNIPKHCRICGSKLLLIEEPDGYWEDNGEPKIKRWLKCPNWGGGQTMYPPKAFITYTALELDRYQRNFIPKFGYTRYQTCDYTVVY